MERADSGARQRQVYFTINGQFANGWVSLALSTQFMTSYTGLPYSTFQCALAQAGSTGYGVVWQIYNKVPSIKIYNAAGTSATTYAFGNWSAEPTMVINVIEFDLDSRSGIARFFINVRDAETRFDG